MSTQHVKSKGALTAALVVLALVICASLDFYSREMIAEAHSAKQDSDSILPPRLVLTLYVKFKTATLVFRAGSSFATSATGTSLSAWTRLSASQTLHARLTSVELV